MFPFIVMGFIGVLNSSVDKIFVYVYLSPAEKSFYQVYMNFLLLVSAMPGWILFPFLKNYFRGGNALRSRIRKTLLLLAFVLIPAALGVIYFFMTRLYHFEVSARMLGFAAIYLVPSFISAPLLYRLLAEGRYYGLTAIAAAGILVTSTLCYLLVPLYGLTGAVCGGIAGQVLLAVLPLLFRDKQSAIS
jgi:O-antigen/teichoic acid export membrane protein